MSCQYCIDLEMMHIDFNLICSLRGIFIVVGKGNVFLTVCIVFFKLFIECSLFSEL